MVPIEMIQYEFAFHHTWGDDNWFIYAAMSMSATELGTGDVVVADYCMST